MGYYYLNASIRLKFYVGRNLFYNWTFSNNISCPFGIGKAIPRCVFVKQDGLYSVCVLQEISF